MITTRFTSAVLLAVSLTATLAVADGEENKAENTRGKLLGVWESVKSVDLHPGTTLEFTNDNKLKLSVPMVIDKDTNTIRYQVYPGTYQVEGSKLKVVVPGPDGKDQKQTLKIVELTDVKLVTKDEKGAVDEFKKPSPK
jgi:uncharacterized protein (TIGR03066 family)